ncbi:hypothetical protein ACROYT_G031323 [Oculina patagonica]
MNEKKTDAEEGPDYNLDDFDFNYPFGENFMLDEETPPTTSPPSPEVPDYSMVESDQDFEDETPTSSPPLTSSPAPPLAEKEDDDDAEGDDDDDDDNAKNGDATPSQDLSQSVERAKWGTPQNPGIQGSESTDLQVLNSMLTKNKDNPGYVVKSPKSKFYGYTIPDIRKARDEILERRGEKKAKSSSVFEKEPPDQEGSGVVDVNDLVDRLYISLGVTILIAKDYELDLREGNFSDLIGFEKKILNDANNVGDHVPNLTRGVDWIYVHCDLVSRAVDNIEDDVLYTLSTSTLQISYP